MFLINPGCRRLRRLVLFVLLGTILGGCGQTTPPQQTETTTTNDWDNMNWDQSPWG